MDGFFYIGKFSELSYVSPPGRNALRRNGMMSLKRPAAGKNPASGILSCMYQVS